MTNSRYALTVYIASANIFEKSPGHMWISLDDNQAGLRESYGFHPASDEMISKVGKVRTDDLQRYPVIYHQQSFPIAEATYHNVHDYCQMSIATNSFGAYIFVGNACVNYAWDVMRAAGIEVRGILNTACVSYIPSFNASDLDMVHDLYMQHWNGIRTRSTFEIHDY